MPEFCLSTSCFQCDYSIVRSGRLFCNYGNRLGASNEVSSYTIAQPSKESLEKAKEERKKSLKKQMTKEEALVELESLEKAMEKVKETEEKVKQSE